MEISQSDLDALVKVLSNGTANGSVAFLREALAARVQASLAKMEEAKSELRDNYRALRAVGGPAIAALEDMQPALTRPDPVPTPDYTPAPPSLPQAEVVEVVRQPIYRKPHKYFRFATLGVTGQDVAAFWKLVKDEFGQPPSYRAMANYFGCSPGSGMKLIELARAAGYPDVGLGYTHGRRTPPGLDKAIARRFGTNYSRAQANRELPK